MTASSRPARLRRQRDFRLVYRKSRRARGLCIELMWYRTPERAYAIVASRRVGTAVLRNALKRRIRVWWQARHEQLPVGYWIVRLLPGQTRRVLRLLHEELDHVANKMIPTAALSI